jgi:sugar lactone lactonase YvrE
MNLGTNLGMNLSVNLTTLLRSMLAVAAVGVGTAIASGQARGQVLGDHGPTLETIKTFDTFKLVGLAVSHEGRIFASAPAAQSGDRLIEVNAQTGAMTPYPDQSWNASGGDTEHQWAVPQAMWVDTADHLWVLDSGRAVMNGAGPAARPKLVEFDLAGNTVIRAYGFDGTVAPTDSLNDVRIDLVHGYAYLTNIANRGSLVVLNLATGKSRNVLAGDRSTFADPKQHLMIGGQPAETADGKPVAIHADGIALSEDAQWLYYRPLTDHNYWRVPTSALIDDRLPADELAHAVQFLGTAELTGGLIMDRHGTLYGGDLEHGTVVALDIDAAAQKLTSHLVVRAPGRLSWADGFAIAQGYLYIADSHLWELPMFKNHLPPSGPFAIFRIKLPD